jgi:hypothetical protein
MMREHGKHCDAERDARMHGRSPESDGRSGPALRSRGSGVQGPAAHMATLTFSRSSFWPAGPSTNVSGAWCN